MKPNKVIIAVDFSSRLPELLEPLKSMDFLAHGQLHFVYVFSTVSYRFDLTLLPVTFPDQHDMPKIEEAGLSVMSSMTSKAVPKNFDGKIVNKILFSDDPKVAFTEYVKENKGDLVIVFSRKKHGLFESSFAQYVNKHTDCDMIFLKHKA